MGTPDSLKSVKQIVTQAAEHDDIVVVVSAMSGVTNQLLSAAHYAQAHQQTYEQVLDQIAKRHHDATDLLVPAEGQDLCHDYIDQFIDNALQLCETVDVNGSDENDEEVYEFFTDAIVHHGELLSSLVLTLMMPKAAPMFATEFIKTMDKGGFRQLDWESTSKAIKRELKPLPARIVVTQGFISQDSSSKLATTLGRGGSDYTAAIIAAVLRAEALEIWTDVDGFYDKDPRKYDDAKLIERMTYAQAQELCDAGAKVVYPPTIAPVAQRHIPTWIKNTFNPTAPGTIICD